MKSIYLFLSLFVLSLLSGCAAPFVFLGGVATSAIIADDRRDPETMLRDEWIELSARKAIATQLRDEAHINVTSFNFIVLLTGQAPTTILRYRAESVTRNISGVRLVYNEITVGPPSSIATQTSDTILTTRVKGAIFNNQFVNTNHVKIVTEQGVVFLMGVLSHTEADHATTAARGVAGVVKVVRLCELLD